MRTTPVTSHHRPSRRRVNACLQLAILDHLDAHLRESAILDHLDAHLRGMHRHLLEIGMPGEAGALLTDLQYVASLRGRVQ